MYTYSLHFTIAGAGPWYFYVLMTLNHYTSLLQNNDQKIRGIDRARIIEILACLLDILSKTDAVVPTCKNWIDWADKTLHALDKIGVNELDNTQWSTDIVQIVGGTTGAIAGTAGAIIAIAGTGGWGVIPYVVLASSVATVGAETKKHVHEKKHQKEI